MCSTLSTPFLSQVIKAASLAGCQAWIPLAIFSFVISYLSYLYHISIRCAYIQISITYPTFSDVLPCFDSVRHCLLYLQMCEHEPPWSLRWARDHLRALLAGATGCATCLILRGFERKHRGWYKVVLCQLERFSCKSQRKPLNFRLYSGYIMSPFFVPCYLVLPGTS